jgi:hypothetical protein
MVVKYRIYLHFFQESVCVRGPDALHPEHRRHKLKTADLPIDRGLLEDTMAKKSKKKAKK